MALLPPPPSPLVVVVVCGFSYSFISFAAGKVAKGATPGETCLFSMRVDNICIYTTVYLSLSLTLSLSLSVCLAVCLCLSHCLCVVLKSVRMSNEYECWDYLPARINVQRAHTHTHSSQTHTQQSRTHMCAMHNNISVCMHTFAYICLHFIVMNLCNNNATAQEQPQGNQIDFMHILRCFLFILIHIIYLFIYSLVLLCRPTAAAMAA